MRRFLPVVLLAFTLVYPSFVLCAVGDDNAIAVSSRNTSLIVDVLTLIVLAITAGVIIWYSLETRKLRIATEKAREESSSAREIELHPWLVGTDLVIDLPHYSTPSIWLPVRNAGKMPALNVIFNSEFHFSNQPTHTNSLQIGSIAPGDVVHFRIIALGNTPKEDLGESISVTITYSTHLKGAGIIKQEFEKIGESWMNKGGGGYTFTLSTGETFSK